MPAGRPTDYRPEYCDLIIEVMSEGLSFASFAATLGVCRDSLNEWASKHPEFSVAKKVANDKRIAWWEKKARGIMDGSVPYQSTTMAIFMMKNAAPDLYNEKSVVQDSPQQSSSIDLSKLTDEQLAALKNASAKNC